MGKKGLSIGHKAPDFELESTKGIIRLDQYTGKPLLLLFIRGTWCPNCRKQLEALQPACSRFDKLGVPIVIIAGQKLQNLIQYADSTKMPFPLLSDSTREVMKAYEVFTPFKWDSFRIAVPSAYLLDKEHVIRYAYIGSSQFDRPGVEDLLEEVQRLIAEP
ncbi:peroxiredoxin family protein [Brevibacillus laterosporus]|uniref:peroxiredoxin family protein n=1 Tax=Brevibacillus laterosporus TaxID=1465 RepID=UPI000B9A7F34|nr:peroxiredoxin family protein [Brevibacillus laterosporus]